MTKRNHDTKRTRQSGVNEISATLDDDDARELLRLSRRSGVSVETLLDAAMALCVRELTGEPVRAEIVESLAKRGFSILRKDELN